MSIDSLSLHFLLYNLGIIINHPLRLEDLDKACSTVPGIQVACIALLVLVWSSRFCLNTSRIGTYHNTSYSVIGNSNPELSFSSALIWNLFLYKFYLLVWVLFSRIKLVEIKFLFYSLALYYLNEGYLSVRGQGQGYSLKIHPQGSVQCGNVNKFVPPSPGSVDTILLEQASFAQHSWLWSLVEQVLKAFLLSFRKAYSIRVAGWF